MKLKIVTPTEIIVERSDVHKVGLETTEGVYCFLPRRLDCAAALVPGILTFTTNDGEEGFVGVDEGLMFKCGETLKVSTHQAYYTKTLGELRKSWQKTLEKYRANEDKASKLLKRMQANIRVT